MTKKLSNCLMRGERIFSSRSERIIIIITVVNSLLNTMRSFSVSLDSLNKSVFKE